jgi:hypothetical protein
VRAEDRLAGEAAERLMPPESTAFFDELWSRVEAHKIARARRGRRLGIATATTCVAAVAAAGVYAGPALLGSTRGARSVLDKTYSCPVQVLTRSHAIDIGAHVLVPYADAEHNPTGKAGPIPANVSVTTVTKEVGGKFVPQLAFDAAHPGVRVDRSTCRSSGHGVTLKPAAGLAPQGSVTLAFLGGFGERCVTASRVVVRARLVLENGSPRSAAVAIRDDAARGRPVALVNWTPKKITYFLSSRCVKLP